MRGRRGVWLFGMAVAVGASSLALPAAAQVPPDRPVLVVGHRGASKLAPEHTGAAYDLAVRAGVDVLECDLQLTQDEQLVCVHDETVDRTTGGAHKGRVDSYTLAELRAMDFGSWFDPKFAGAKIMTLEEQLTCYRGIDPTMQFYLETKAPATYDGRMEPLLARLLQRLELVPAGGEPDVRTSPVIIQSFDNESLAAMRKIAPTLPTALLTTVGQPPFPEGVQPQVYAAIAPTWESQPALINDAHARGLEAHTWTVDDLAQMTNLVDLGIDGFFTNDPAAGRKVVDLAGRGSGRKTSPPVGEDATSAAGCPAGAGVGFPRADDVTTSTPATADDGTAQAAPTVQAGDDDGFPVVLVAIAVGLVAVVIAVVVVLRRRRPSAST